MSKSIPRGKGEGWVLEFPNDSTLMLATQTLLNTPFTQWEVIACYPCKAVQLSSMRRTIGRQNWISAMALLGGILGILSAITWVYLTQFTTSNLVIPGQEVSWGRWASYMPAFFVSGLLGSGIGSFISFMASAGLPRWYDWLFEDDEFAKKASSSGFFIALGGELNKEMLQIIGSLGALHTHHIQTSKIHKEVSHD